MGTGPFTLDIKVPRDLGVEKKTKSTAEVVNEY